MAYKDVNDPVLSHTMARALRVCVSECSCVCVHVHMCMCVGMGAHMHDLVSREVMGVDSHRAVMMGYLMLEDELDRRGRPSKMRKKNDALISVSDLHFI